MRVSLDLHSGVPAYRQIVDQIRFQIAAGALPAETALPSTRALGESLGINPMTVSKAYALLEDEGLLQHHPGLPLTVRPRSAAEADAAREAELRNALLPAARAAALLGFSAHRAAQLLRDVMASTRADEDGE